MREIKFRSWLKERKILSEVLIINYKDSTVQLPIETDVIEDYWWDETTWSFDEVELMQYTGLKDKNGKEIYEGDIIQIKFYFGLVKFKVIFADGGFYLSSIFEEDSGYDRFVYEYKDFGIEVIGNIYENPELIIK